MRTSSLVRHLLAFSGCFTKPDKAFEPTITPFNRQAAEVEPADSYEPEALVWVYVAGGWRFGRVIDSTAGSVMVCYYTPGSGDTAVEAVTASHVIRRKL